MVVFLLEVVYHLLAGMILQVSPTPPYKTDQNACPVVSYGGSPVFSWKKPEKTGEKVNMQSLNMFSPLKMRGFSHEGLHERCEKHLRGLDEHEILQTSWHSKNPTQAWNKLFQERAASVQTIMNRCEVKNQVRNQWRLILKECEKYCMFFFFFWGMWYGAIWWMEQKLKTLDPTVFLSKHLKNHPGWINDHFLRISDTSFNS